MISGLNNGSLLGIILPLTGIVQCLEAFLVITTGNGGVLLLSSGR